MTESGPLFSKGSGQKPVSSTGDRLRIYPTELKVYEVEKKSGRAGPGGFGGNAISIFRFEEMLIGESPFGADRVSDVERWLLLHDAVLSEMFLARNRVISSLASSDGFVRSVGELIQQIKLGLVGSDEMKRITGYAPGKEGWIKKVFNRYQDSLEKKGLADSADKRRELIKKISASGEIPGVLLRYSGIDFFDIYHYTPFRFELIYSLAKYMNIVVHFPLPDGRRKAFDFVEGDIGKFQGLEDTEGMLELAFDEEPANTAVDASGAGEPSIVRLSGSIFSEEAVEEPEGSASPLPPTGIEVFKNSGRYREIEETAGRIAALKGNRDWSDFCIVFRDLERYGIIIEEVFKRAGIPVYLRRGLPVRTNPYVKTVLGIFSVIETGFDRDEVVKLAASDYFEFLKGVDTGEMEKALFEAGIINGHPSLWRERIARLEKRESRYPSSALKKLATLLTSIENLSKSKSAKTTIDNFEKTVKLLGPKRISFGDPFFGRDLFSKARLDEIVSDTGAAIKKHGMAKSPFDWRDLRRLILNSAGNVPLPFWSDKNRVYALNVHELSGKRFPYIFLCGLHDGEFPRKTEYGSILSESEKRLFNMKHAETALEKIPERKRGRTVFSRLGEMWDEESFLFYLTLRSAETGIFFSYSTHDLNGSELGRSPFLDDLYAVFPGIEERVTEPVALGKGYTEQLDRPAREAKLLRDLFNLPSDEAGTVRGYYSYFANRPGTGEGFRLSCERSRIERERRGFYSEFDPEKRFGLSTVFTGNVGKGGGVEEFFAKVSKKGFSPTAFESYSKCAFRYFMDKPLECRPLDLPKADIERTLKGTIMHKILERYYKPEGEFRLASGLQPESVRLKKIMEIAKSVFKEQMAEENIGEEGLWEITKEQLTASLKRYIDYEDRSFSAEPFTVLSTEMDFGPEKDNRLMVKAGNKELELTGSIDRLDYLPGVKLLRVVDYKYAGNISKYTRLIDPEKFGTESFQMPIYMLAGYSYFGKKEFSGFPLEGTSASYVPLKKIPDKAGKKNGNKKFVAGEPEAGSSGAQIDSDGFRGKLASLVERMESGDFSVSPEDCTFCKYRRACRYKEVRNVEFPE